jgi:hypothetical protein
MAVATGMHWPGATLSDGAAAAATILQLLGLTSEYLHHFHNVAPAPPT